MERRLALAYRMAAGQVRLLRVLGARSRETRCKCLGTFGLTDAVKPFGVVRCASFILAAHLCLDLSLEPGDPTKLLFLKVIGVIGKKRECRPLASEW
jgi:hypothetical protein